MSPRTATTTVHVLAVPVDRLFAFSLCLLDDESYNGAHT
jgi:hypothetical protein